ncbi:14317_t:CDS:2, partial [Dentiscutata erythropus]
MCTFTKICNFKSVLESNFIIDIDRYFDDHDQSKLTNYINLSKGTETIDEELIEKLELKIRTNIILWHFKKAIDTLKQWIFPYACMHSDILSPLLDYTSNGQILMHEEFYSEYESSNPFFVWKNKKYDKEISKLLNGEGITIIADIRESNPKKSAIKFNEIGIKLKSINKTLQNKIDNELKRFTITMVHSGKSYYRYKNKFYVIRNDEQCIEYSFEKTKTREPIVKIESIEDDDFSKLKTFEKEVNLELVEREKYIKTKGSNGPTLE